MNPNLKPVPSDMHIKGNYKHKYVNISTIEYHFL